MSLFIAISDVVPAHEIPQKTNYSQMQLSALQRVCWVVSVCSCRSNRVTDVCSGTTFVKSLETFDNILFKSSHSAFLSST